MRISVKRDGQIGEAEATRDSKIQASLAMQEGEKVKPGDVIAEIETDKATMEYEAIDEGTLAKIVVPEGTQDVPVNQLIAVLAEEGEDVKAAAAGAEKNTAPAAKPASTPKPASAAAPVASAEARPSGASRDPQAQNPRPAEGVKAPASKGQVPGAASHGADRVFSSPLAPRHCPKASATPCRTASARTSSGRRARTFYA